MNSYFHAVSSAKKWGGTPEDYVDIHEYCDGKGNSKASGNCGFCESGIPLDTQEDWDASWGKLPEALQEIFRRVFKEEL